MTLYPIWLYTRYLSESSRNSVWDVKGSLSRQYPNLQTLIKTLKAWAQFHKYTKTHTKDELSTSCLDCPSWNQNGLALLKDETPGLVHVAVCSFWWLQNWNIPLKMDTFFAHFGKWIMPGGSRLWGKIHFQLILSTSQIILFGNKKYMWVFFVTLRKIQYLVSLSEIQIIL